MAQEQNYQVNYTINVEASQGTKQVMAFAESVARLNQAKTSFGPALENINRFMKDIDKAFRPKGRKRDYSFKLDVNTGNTDKKLEKIKSQLLEIHGLTKGITLAIHTGKPLDAKAVKSQVKATVQYPSASTATAKTAAQSITETQQKITKAVGKVNAALISLEKGREVRINTDAATARLQQLLSLMDRLKSASALNMAIGIPGTGARAGNTVPYAPGAYQLSGKAQARLQEKLYARQQLQDQRVAFRQQQDEAKARAKAQLEATRQAGKEQQLLLRQQEETRKKALIRQQQADREAEKQNRRNAAESLRHMQRQAGIENSLYGGKRRAACNTPKPLQCATCRSPIC